MADTSEKNPEKNPEKKSGKAEKKAEKRSERKADHRSERRPRRRKPSAPLWWPLPACALLGLAAGGAYGVLKAPEYAATSYVVAVPDDTTELLPPPSASRRPTPGSRPAVPPSPTPSRGQASAPRSCVARYGPRPPPSPR